MLWSRATNLVTVTVADAASDDYFELVLDEDEPRCRAKPRSRARKLHKRLHTHRTFDAEQVDLNEKAPTCGAFAEPSDGLEPSTPSLP